MLKPLAAILLSLSTVAGADIYQQITNCKALTEMPDKLRCFESLPDSAPIANANEIKTAWDIELSQSAIDDSKTVIITAEAAANGDERIALALGCKETELIALIGTGLFFGLSAENVPVVLRFDSEKAETESWTGSPTGEVLITPRPQEFIERLIAADQLTLRVTSYSKLNYDATFNLAGLDAHIPELKSACPF